MYREEFQWPEGKKNAVMISLTLDAEYFGIAQYPEDKNAVAGFKTMAEFGVKKGLDRVLSVLDTYHVKATVFVPGKVAEEYPDAMKKIVEHGHEIGVHGYEHENFALLPEEKQKEAMEKSVEAVKEVCGVTPVGFRAPEGELTRRTLKIAKEAGIVYSSTLGNDDRPYYNVLNDQGTSMLEIPFHWALFDAPYFAFHFWPPVPYGQGRISSFKKVLTKIETLAKAGYFDPSGLSMNHITSQAAWLKHNAALIPNGLWLENEMKSSTPASFKMRYYPSVLQDAGQKTTVVATATSVGIAAKAKNPKAAEAFLRFLYTDKVAAKFAELCAVPSATRTDVSKANLTESAKQVNEMINSSEVTLISKGSTTWGSVDATINQCINKLVSGDMTVDKVISELQKATKKKVG